MKINALFAAMLVLPALAVAAGPDTVARADRSLWPEPIDNPAAFDRASRAEILVFAAALADESALDAQALQDKLHIKQADHNAVLKVQARLGGELMKNWKAAGTACKSGEDFCPAVDSFAQLAEAGHHVADKLPARYLPWYADAQVFHLHYADELLRLAALFPRISSEIDTYSPLERNGFELPDRRFQLTFDDGPTDKGGNTDLLLPLLAQQGVHASFYMLGERLQARLQQTQAPDLQQSYQGQCTSLHGWQHLSHQKWEQWQDSVTKTRDLVKATFPNNYQPWFRPPYGQRRSDSGSFFAAQGLGVALWNIDSQDWNAHVSGPEAAQRVMSLMLLWRHGVILFHDIHPKAQYAVPWLISHTQGSGVSWQDCRGYAAVGEGK